jgi:SpoU rRNA methylase family enzyme
MDIIKALTSTYSLEGEFEVQKSIQFIEKLEDIELLKPYAIKLLQTNAKQAHFISSSIEVISQQAAYIFKLEKQLKKKKATFWDRIRYVLFNKKSRN